MAPGTWPESHSSCVRTSTNTQPPSRAAARSAVVTSGASAIDANLRRQHVDRPTAAPPRVPHAVVEAVVAVRPELDRLGTHAVAAPMPGPGDVAVRVALVQRGDAGLEPLAAR